MYFPSYPSVIVVIIVIVDFLLENAGKCNDKQINQSKNKQTNKRTMIK